MKADIKLEKETSLKDFMRLFADVAQISGVSGNEKNVNQFIRNYLSDLPFEIIEDEAGRSISGNSGNLIVHHKNHDFNKASTAFIVHMYTVRDTSKAIIEDVGDRIVTSNNAQLGADNRLGVALLLWNLKFNTASIPDNVLHIFTIGEEIGMKGAMHLDTIKLKVEQAIVFDSALDPGYFIQKCAGMYLFDITFIGKSAHSAVSNGEGINAISIAAKALSEMSEFALPEDVTRNFGLIKGGQSTNVIASECTVSGEIRGFDTSLLIDHLEKLEDISKTVAQNSGGECIWSIEKDFEPYIHPEESPLVQLITSALLKAGCLPNGVPYYGGSDANVLNEKGIPSINIGIGAKNPHSDDEYVTFDSIQKLLSLLVILNEELK